MDRLLNVMTGLQPAADRPGAAVGAPRAYSRGIFGELAGGGSRAAGVVAMARAAGPHRQRAGPATARPLALLVVTGALFLLVLYRLSMMISSLKDSNIALAQRLAILEFRLESDEETKAQRS